LGTAEEMNIPELTNQLKETGIDTKIAQQILYVNPAVVQKNRKEYPENQWPKEASKRITVYVPEKYQEQIEDIKKIIYYEWFQYTTIDIE
ncbi:ABC transporter permease, partial [Enterococcus faecalis]